MEPILIIDDDADIRMLVSEMLTEQGFPILEAANGKIGLRVLKEAAPKPILILLDLMMPVMGGMEFLSIVQEDTTLSNIPIVVVSAFESGVHEVQGARKLVRKPTSIPELLKTVYDVLAIEKSA